MLVFSLMGMPVQGQQTTTPGQPEIDPYAKGVACKKEIGREPSTWRWNIPVVMPYVTHGVVKRKSMDRDVRYHIYLPPGYAEATETRYPVVYYLHGATGSESSDEKVVECLMPEIKEDRIGPVIYVFVNVGQFSGYRDDPKENVMAETYTINELIPSIEHRYRTLANRMAAP